MLNYKGISVIVYSDGYGYRAKKAAQNIRGVISACQLSVPEPHYVGSITSQLDNTVYKRNLHGKSQPTPHHILLIAESPKVDAKF